jgi:hypothetical protein
MENLSKSSVTNSVIIARDGNTIIQETKHGDTSVFVDLDKYLIIPLEQVSDEEKQRLGIV